MDVVFNLGQVKIATNGKGLAKNWDLKTLRPNQS